MTPVLSFRTAGWRRWPLDLCLRHLSEQGYGAVELCLEHPDLAPRSLVPNRVEEVRALLATTKLGVAALSFHGKREHPALRAATWRSLVELSPLFPETRVLVVGSPLPRNPTHRGEEFGELVLLLRDLCARAADLGRVVALEPEPGTLISDVADFGRLVDGVHHDALRINLDLGHVHITEPDPIEAIQSLAPMIAHVHVEGMDRGEHRHLLPGQGDLDLARALDALWSYSGPLTVDLFDIEDDPPGWSAAAIGALRGVLDR